MIAAGQSIGNYRILNKIGTGGMGAVYLAEHPLIGKRVALKVIHRELASNREVVQRFFQEAKAVNKIGNEHIVEIHDFGITPEGDHFYIMEFLEGRTLASVIHHERALAIMRALHVGAQIASALAAAHAAGIIHRDLKPDNVMLTTRLGDSDFVKLLDFGLAKMFAGGQSAVKTAAGVLLGTPQYMSPESCESRPNVDHRTDIYALGILLFQMLTGVLPFDGETMGEVLVKQVTQLPPPLRAINANIPSSVEQIVLRCLAKQPDARFPTMLVLREALLEPDRYLTQSPPIAPTRSMAPGEAPVDAKTIMAYAAQHQQAQAATRIGMANELPLLAPPAMGNASAATIFGGAPAPIPLAPSKKTIALGPDLSMPAPQGLSTHTMQIATPLGYSSRPPQRVWPIVLLIAALLGLIGGGIAVARFKHNNAVAAVEPDAAVPVVVKPPPVQPPPQPQPKPPPPQQTSVTPIGSAAVAPPTALIEIDSSPPGAEIFGPDAQSLGKTPAKLALPIATTALTYELRLAGYRKATKQFIVTGDAVVDVPMQRLPPAQTAHRPRVHRPDDLEAP
ncbi:MAG TPA: serine/threonine-protein kinase [Kofleriaceae bacterium]|nr:serine/threonine-protein kinase [Kofleriaceae bacterium]